MNLTEVEPVFWTDNENVLRWIKNGPGHVLKFVNTRIERILAVSSAKSWRYVPTKLNPADLASRGLSAEKLAHNELWFNGPDFLKREEETWPMLKEELQAQLQQQENLAVVPAYCIFSLVQTRVENTTPKTSYLEGHCWTETLKRAKLIISSQRNVRMHRLKQDIPPLAPTQLLLMAQIAISYDAVQLYEPELLEFLKKPKVHSNIKSKVLEHGLKAVQVGRMTAIVSVSRQTIQSTIEKEVRTNVDYVRERLRSTPRRTREQNLEEAMRRMQLPPRDHDLIYLPANSKAAMQLIRYTHFKTAHGSANRMLVELHKRFWIPRARGMAKKIAKSCRLCVLKTAKFIQQPEAPLPMYRSFTHRAFQTIGVDFTKTFPPIPGIEGNPSILVITCTYYRIAILVPVIGQTHDTFLNAFNVFRNTRSTKPDLIVSDSAKAFKLAFEQLKIQQQESPINWKFNMPRTPWWGGFFERLMRIIEGHITSLFEDHKFASWGKFTAAVALLERLVNSRPILEVYDGRDDVPTTITPNQFLNPQAEENFNLVLADLLNRPISMEPASISELLTRQYDQAELFRRMVCLFQSLYHMELRKFHNTPMYSRVTQHQLKVGDAVLLKPEFDFKPGAMRRRLLWPRGRVVELVKTARDNVIRAVKVQVRLPGGKTKDIGPIAVQKVAPLEIYV
jgi:hypothetical protein